MRFAPAISRVALAGTLVLFSAFAARGAIWLSDAVDEGLVTVDLRGNGSSSGDAVILTVRRTATAPAGEFELFIEPGTVLAPSSIKVEKLVVASVRGEKISPSYINIRPSIRVPEDKEATYILEAYGTEYAKENPTGETTFQFEPVSPQLGSLLTVGKKLGLDIKAMQAAVWIVTSKMSYELITERFPVSTEQWKNARVAVSVWRRLGKETASSAPPEPVGTPCRPVSVENLTGEAIHLDIEGATTTSFDLAAGETSKVPIANGTYTVKVRYGETPDVYRTATLKALINDSTTYLRLKPPTGKLARPATAK